MAHDHVGVRALHRLIFHVLLNMYTLWIFGQLLEGLLGRVALPHALPDRPGFAGSVGVLWLGDPERAGASGHPAPSSASWARSSSSSAASAATHPAVRAARHQPGDRVRPRLQRRLAGAPRRTHRRRARGPHLRRDPQAVAAAHCRSWLLVALGVVLVVLSLRYFYLPIPAADRRLSRSPGAGAFRRVRVIHSALHSWGELHGCNCRHSRGHGGSAVSTPCGECGQTWRSTTREHDEGRMPQHPPGSKSCRLSASEWS